MRPCPLFNAYTILTVTCRSESPIVAKLQYGMKITFIFILILFIDSVNRVYRVQVELADSKDLGGYAI
jgi:B-cell receptor-associated protein 31